MLLLLLIFLCSCGYSDYADLSNKRTYDSTFVDITFLKDDDQITIFVANDFIVDHKNKVHKIWSVNDVKRYIERHPELYVPTPFIVDKVYEHSTCKLRPVTINPKNHNNTRAYGGNILIATKKCNDNTLISGHKKDIVQNSKGEFGIYGWHTSYEQKIQPFFTGHADTYKDYSQGFRPMLNVVFINGNQVSAQHALEIGLLEE